VITGIHHTGLVVDDLDAMIDFYRTRQSFALLHRFDIEDDPANRAMLRVDNAAAKCAFLRGSLGNIELFAFDSGPSNPPAREVYSAGIRHICLQTAIDDALFDALVDAGAGTHARPAGLGTGNSYVYIRDPEGNVLELEGTPWAPAAATRPWVAHTAIVTPDIDRLTRFYAMLTGIEIHQRGDFGPDAKFDLVAGVPGVEFLGAWMRLANAELEFWQYRQPETHAVPPIDFRQPGWNHLCFESDDIDADHARLVAAGVDIHQPPTPFGTARIFFGRDPDGNVFEVLQPGPDARAGVAAMLAEAEGRAVDDARTAFRAALAS
jgi:catechol 2,3-dioxygenase-like lactoylglutathione lyase family enzyme